MSGDLNARSKRVSFRCPLELLAELEILAGRGSLSQTIVEMLRAGQRYAAVEARYQALLASDPTLPRW